VLEDVRQSFDIANVANQRADVKQLGKVRHRVAIAKRGGRHANERADVCHEAVVLRPIVIDRRLRLGPRAIEQRDQSMMNDVDETAQVLKEKAEDQTVPVEVTA
jgi:hypothetical protein